jgi:cellulose synthase operon protein C
LRLALDLLESRNDSPWEQRARACNSRSGEALAAAAHFFVMTRRYREAIGLLSRAVKTQPNLWAAHASLAMQLMRDNRLEEARSHLETAYRGDPYGPEVVNMLRLLEKLEGFRSYAPSESAEEGAGIELRLHADEAAVLEPYVRRLTRAAMRHFGTKYRFALEEPIVIELYPDHDDFAVRTAGLPGLGILGATFGTLVAMDSPSARRTEDEFFWGSVLWHELAHVYTLEATEHRVPRWFSEGISMYEEWTSGPARQPDLPIDFIEALEQGKLLPLAELDQGFQRPSWPGQVNVSYVQAGLACAYIAQTFGEARLVALLEGYRDGSETAELLPRVLERPLETLDAELAAFARRRAGALLGDTARWRTALQRARAELKAERWQRALDFAQQAAQLRPDDVSLTSPHLLRARAQRGLGNAAAELAELERYHALGGRDPNALRELATALSEAGRRDAAIGVLEDLAYVTPLEPSLHADLGRWLLDAGRPAEALAELEIWKALKPRDQVALNFALAEAFERLARREEARRHVLYALEIAPEFRPAQRLLLEIHR